VPKPFDPDTVCEASIYDVLVPQQFQDCITTTPPTTTQVVSAQKSDKERHDWTRVSRRQPSKAKEDLSALVGAPQNKTRRPSAPWSANQSIKVEAMFCTWCALSLESVHV
jgi:hypothetical protein